MKFTTIPPRAATTLTRALLLSLLTFNISLLTPASAQTVGKISIGGKVYGGGKQGAILTGNTTNPAVADAKDVTLINRDFTADAAQASQVTINATNDGDVQIVAVFGGGEMGRAYGKTNVTITGGTIGLTDMADANPNKSVNGNAFGAGDGDGADVFGGTHVLITDGMINGSVYGGGNQADLVGSTELTLQGGKYVGAVFGGAKQADIFGRTFVNIDGEHAQHDLHIIDVYGGNDIAGNINPSENWSWTQTSALSANTPFALASTPHLSKLPNTVVNGTWNAFVLATDPANSSDDEVKTKKVLIDNIYGGGNGDYDYASAPYSGLNKPVIDRTYLQIEGGMYGSLYGGGNAATVAVSTDICLVNSTDASKDYLLPLGNLDNPDDPEHPTTTSLARFSPDYQFNRVFGGNNKEPMAIRPNWYLEKATVNNLYSGGNAGPMIFYDGSDPNNSKGGIILAIESSDMEINNVYGGCRMADVNPGEFNGDASKSLASETFLGQAFEKGYSARVLIKGGNINNVYGGNDVSGNVYYGAQVEILSSIKGDVYGAGNGSYAYTDNASWVAAHPEDADYYYDPSTAASSVEALNNHRPNVEKSWVHVAGDAENFIPTVIGGSLYCGGNSATLRTTSGDLKTAKAHLQIGSYVIADQVFQGSNGVNMISQAMLEKYADNNFTSLNLANTSKDYNGSTATEFDKYMEGVEVAIMPEVAFDANYEPHSAKIGSLYCGGNVGSMSADGLFTINFLNSLLIYDKLVGGSNSANVEVKYSSTDPSQPLNTYHMGGLIGEPGANGNKVQLNVAGLKLEPHILNHETFSLLEFNIVDGMLQHGNIYGGCYDSGYINGGVNINISENTISDMVAGSGVQYETIQNDVLASTLSVYGGGYGEETEIWGNVTIDITNNGQIMKAYGGGEKGVVGKLDRYVYGDDIPAGKKVGDYKTDTVQEWYSQTTRQDIHGYDTPVTQYLSKDHEVAKFVQSFNTTVNLNATVPAQAEDLNVAKLYGGGFQGTVSGVTTVNLNRGRVYDAFGGASNADILEHTEMYVGKESAPQVMNNVYGANDFGGLIVGKKTFTVENPNDVMESIDAQAYVEYTSGNIAGSLYGGPCGAYIYSNYPDVMKLYTYSEYKALDGNGSITEDEFNKLSEAARTKPGFCKPQLLKDMITDADQLVLGSGKGYAANSFVNIISQSTLSTDHIGGSIFGAGQGLKGYINLADERGSYVRLMSAKKTQRTAVLADRVYGAGYCSNTERSLIDAYDGYYNKLLGGAHGISYEELIEMGGYSDAGHYETNYMGYRAAVRLHDMVNDQMDIFGGGANAGAQETGVVLYGGVAHNIYGASLDQGITYAASVEIPTTSKSKVNAIFGGAKGLEDEYPCDVYNTFVTYLGQDARVNDAIYGGNDAYRMTRNAYIRLNVPLLNENGQFTNVFGGGFGENTVTLYTHIGLEPGAEVANVYGGGNNGQILDTPSFRYFLDDGLKACPDGYKKQAAEKLKHYPGKDEDDSIYGYQKYLLDSEVIGFHHWIVKSYWKPDANGDYLYDTNDTPQPIGSYTSKAYGHAVPLYFLSTQIPGKMHTNVYIEGNATKTAIVHENAFGGGLGAKALVSGKTQVKLNGGTVIGDIYGGGYGGDVKEYAHLIYPASTRYEETMSATNIYMGGGIARNVYGGGLNGKVVGSTHVTLGAKDEQEYNFYGEQAGSFGDMVVKGDPVVERSLYGGGQQGAVEGTAYMTINQGHIGYKYDATAVVDDATRSSYQTKIDAETDDAKKAALQAELATLEKSVKYIENLDLNNPGDNYLNQNGNAFGAGYGENASVDVTYINMYGGTIRNSLYGGGEIATVGRGKMKTDVGADKVVDEITMAGRTNIFMYNGLVRGDVFGGGRGFSYDLTGNEVLGKAIHTEGYVFGTTNVEIRGGIVGTPETVEEGHGNVFGGGNIGYCFTDAKKKGVKGGTSADDLKYQGRYYTKEWVCDTQNGGCGNHEFMYNEPIVCAKCGKSTNATDDNFRTAFTDVTAGRDILSEDCRVVIAPYAQVTAAAGIEITGNGTTLPDGSTLSTKTFAKGDYVPTEYLDLLRDKNTDKSEWAKLSLDGVIVRNAVFAGGNVSSGSDKVYANAVTVFGNATASVNDVFFRDLVTIGTEHIGGLYGDGNLTFVDGYRELNITNYGTDYYGQQDYITLDQYNAMNDRERAYFELEYQTETVHDYIYRTCLTAHQFAGRNYVKGQQITPAEYTEITTQGIGTDGANDKPEFWSAESTTHYEAKKKIKESEYDLMTSDEKKWWTQYGFCSIYAGRLLNTIQRADFCGIFGSRMVLQGAQDRVPEVVDYTQYTINRVGELSLNQDEFQGTGIDGSGKYHGNYIGFYNVVNYLGALTSDVKFEDIRTTDNTDAGYAADGSTSYYEWKVAHETDRKRNNGTCHNMVALASGVYLELVNEPTTNVPLADVKDPYKKDWGLITGIVQLDLINVMPGLGGGYVYAKNEHGTRGQDNDVSGLHENLSIYNKNAVNNQKYIYNESTKLHIETSGNFIHNLKQIVDDCYPAGGSWNDYIKAPAHYWYIRGEIYVYDQYISAFTGSTTAYQENINLPLTITAGANGRLDLLDIKPNYYAYYNDKGQKLGATDFTVVNNVTYGLNDVITYWEYMQLSDAQKQQFVPETYVCVKDYCTADDFDDEHNPRNVFKAGEVLLPGDYEALVNAQTMVFDPEDVSQTDAGVYHMKEVKKSDLFHVSNAVSHENGYVLGVSLSNPVVWDNWYSPESGYLKINTDVYNDPSKTDKTDYKMGPSYYTTESGLYGQREYAKDDIITGTVYSAYQLIPSADKTNAAKPVAEGGKGRTQATVAAAYVAIAPASYTYNEQPKNVQEGVAISYNEYASPELDAATKAKFAPAYTCTSTYEVDAKAGKYIYYGELISDARRKELIDALTSRTENPLSQTEAEALVNAHFDNAYIVTSEDGGWYGGQHFVANENYEAINTWATLSADDREAFHFRYDALDALVLSNYPGTGKEGPGNNGINQYDGQYWTGTWNNTDDTDVAQVYGAKQAIDYTAEYRGSETLQYVYQGQSKELHAGDPEIGREEYESLLNEQRHYSHFMVDTDGDVYIVKSTFVMGNTPYKAGRVLTADEYAAIGQDLQNNNVVTFYATANKDYYVCREGYTIDTTEGTAVKDLNNGNHQYNRGDVVPAGIIISGDESTGDYKDLKNKQTNFVVHGDSPIETSTFFVNRESNIYDLSKERVITLVYQYRYEESDESGKNIEEITERHVVNIHIEFKSGVPTIGQLQEPAIVLPGDAVGLKQPNVTPGAYELLGGGWELFTTPEDAAKHQNGKEYINSATPMYWYQDGYWVAYYAKTYLGKTYSNSVQFKVANYHDIADVMADNENYMFIDHPDVKRNSKIYISNNVVENLTVNHADAVDKELNEIVPEVRTESEIDMLYSLFQNSLDTSLKKIWVDEQVVNGAGEKLYYKVVDGVRTDEQTTEVTAFPVTKKVPDKATVLNGHVRNLANLDFYLSDDVRTAKDGGWVSIGGAHDDINNTDEGCFMGTLHGMGHTISGLDHSLFGELCGYVYNLGVTGSFVESGVADRVAEGIVPDSGDPDNDIDPTHIYGYVNSSWIYTSKGTDPDADDYFGINMARIDGKYRPVVGDENDFTKGLAGMHVHNCYYPVECNYPVAIMSNTPNATATPADLKQFNNGEVTYDLNGWYLNKRYQDKVATKAKVDADTTGDAATYKYWRQDENGNLIKETNGGATEGYYIAGGSMHAYHGRNLGYVERLYADGDFVYRNGTIPLETNERYSSPDSRYVPIWPDDYYFFGQTLTYGYDEANRPYQPLPSMIRKTEPTTTGAGHDSRLVQTRDNNVVYRIPAYFRSAEKRWAHFNPYAVFADHIEEGYYLGENAEDPANAVLNGRLIHNGLTALDFTGFNDRAIMVDAGTDNQKFMGETSILANYNPELVYSNGARNISDKTGYDAKFKPLDDGAYFGPITDYTTLMSFETHDITQNLLAYAPTMEYSHGTKNTLSVLRDYFNEPAYAELGDDPATTVDESKYRRVAALSPSLISGVRGHIVEKQNTDATRHFYYAPTDHFLVDAQDFNAPIEYEFPQAEGHIMWYQRAPRNTDVNSPDYNPNGLLYADQNSGWEGVSLPFGAELVTTQQKGEITHFYQNRVEGGYNAGYNSGHEYWLREFRGVGEVVPDPENPTEKNLVADMNYPVGEDDADDKVVTNSFLWDYYYNADGIDKNEDDYNNGNIDPTRYWYKDDRTFEEYPLSKAGKPYIVGFPGSRYYEFDLSGTFVPQNSGNVTPGDLQPQTITFASNTGITIHVSDDELLGSSASGIGWDGNVHDGYTFAPNYLNITASNSATEVFTSAEEYNEIKGTSLSDDEFAALTDAEKEKNIFYYVLNSAGSAYVKTTAATPVAAFRPFFASTPSPKLKAPATRSITFGMGGDTQFEPDEETIKRTVTDGLHVSVKKHKIFVESGMNRDVNVRIATTAGIIISAFDICPGEIVETVVDNAGVYLVNNKKVVVK